jgi:hypothetical protein
VERKENVIKKGKRDSRRQNNLSPDRGRSRVRRTSTKEYQAYLDKMREKYPEIFPEVMEKGYKLQGLVNSKRQKLTTKRIKLKSNKEAYQISTL